MAKFIQKMTVGSGDYVRYLPVPPAGRAWGIVVTAAGHTTVAAGTPYPVGEHPADHAFDWRRGRVLEALQLVVVAAGSGRLETARSRAVELRAGDAFVIFPHRWHRYRPGPAGWTESWVELAGPVVDALLAAGELSVERPVLPAARAAEVESAVARLHPHVRAAGIGPNPPLSAHGLAVLAAWVSAGQASAAPRRLDRVLNAAERQLAMRYAEPVNIAALAGELGIAYSHFRHEFQRRTGHSPWQYVLHLRIQEARRLLAGTDATLDAIGATLGFSSAFHFSAAFKRATGESPAQWRRQRMAAADDC